MKTPAEVVKENFWIGAKGGLIDLKHYLKMRESVWLFLYLLRNQTALNQAGEGVVNYGHSLRIRDIASDMKGIPERTIERWLGRLKREGYIRTEYHSNQGITFWIAKGKAKTRKVKVTREQALGILNSPPQMAESFPNSPPDVAGSSLISPPQIVEESEEAVENAALAIPTPKDFTSENPSYYNKDAGAHDAPLSSLSLKEVLRKIQTPVRSSQAELDETRRKLLLQAEEIKRKYPSKSSPGKVVEMQPQEATA